MHEFYYDRESEVIIKKLLKRKEKDKLEFLLNELVLKRMNYAFRVGKQKSEESILNKFKQTFNIENE